MKKLFLAFVFVLFFFGMAQGEYWLACDKPSGSMPTASEVSVNGTVVQGLIQASQDGQYVILLNLTSLTPDKYTFLARWKSSSGWWSEWSVPFDAEKPHTPLLKIVED